jgi:hypothetical protein
MTSMFIQNTFVMVLVVVHKPLMFSLGINVFQLNKVTHKIALVEVYKCLLLHHYSPHKKLSKLMIND